MSICLLEHAEPLSARLGQLVYSITNCQHAPCTKLNLYAAN